MHRRTAQVETPKRRSIACECRCRPHPEDLIEGKLRVIRLPFGELVRAFQRSRRVNALLDDAARELRYCLREPRERIACKRLRVALALVRNVLDVYVKLVTAVVAEVLCL